MTNAYKILVAKIEMIELNW